MTNYRFQQFSRVDSRLYRVQLLCSHAFLIPKKVYPSGVLLIDFSFDNQHPASELPTSYAYGCYAYGVAPASQLSAAIPMGWPQPSSYQLFLLLFLWGSPTLPVTSYSYGYSYGLAPASQLAAIPMG